MKAGMISWIYDYFATRRTTLLASTAVVLLIAAFCAARVELNEDAEAMLPDDDSQLAVDFQILKEAPFAQKVIVHLRKTEALPHSALFETADALAAGMAEPYFSRVVTGPGDVSEMEVLSWLMDSMALKATEHDLEVLNARLSKSEVEARLGEIFRMLNTPESASISLFVREDPLDFRSVILAKLLHVNLVPNARLSSGYFLSPDEQSVLLVAETAVPMTDFEEGLALIENFNALASDLLPAGVEATLICGHRYTVANAETIQDDLLRILPGASLAILLVFIVFLRSWSSIIIVLIPLCVLPIAISATGLIHGAISGITIGFGAVLVGIGVDLALHVYFAIKYSDCRTRETIARIGRPLVLAALTTMGAFGTTLVSVIPIQRQLAVFSITGLCSALLLSLFVFPHLLKPASGALSSPRRPGRSPRYSRVVVFAWIAVFLCSAGLSTQVRFSGNLREVGVVPAELRRDEEILARTWGHVRDMTLLVVEGDTLEEALQENDRLFAAVSPLYAAGEFMSLSPLLPARATQEENQARWTAFWNAEKRNSVRETLLEAGGQLGFSDHAFDGFLNRLGGTGETVTIDELERLGFGDVLTPFMMGDSEGRRILSMASEENVPFSALREAVPAGVRVISPSHFSSGIAASIEGDFLRFLILAVSMVLALLLVMFRNAKELVLASAPPVFGVVFMLAVMALLGYSLNLFNIVAAVFVLGLGVDYGIFMVYRMREECDGATERAVFVSGLTTLAGFGALILARHPALQSIGLTVTLGISGALVAALVVVPRLYSRREGAVER